MRSIAEVVEIIKNKVVSSILLLCINTYYSRKRENINYSLIKIHYLRVRLNYPESKACKKKR